MNDQEINDVCPICYDNSDDDMVTLICNHTFHYDCILNTYKNYKKWKSSFYQTPNLSTNKKRTCPYCRGYGGYLYLKPGMIPIEHIHKEYKKYIEAIANNDIDELKKYLLADKCFAILKTGINKNKQCSRNKLSSNVYCRIHLKKYGQSAQIL